MPKVPSFKDIIASVSGSLDKQRSRRDEAEDAGVSEDFSEDPKVSPRAFLVISRNCPNCEKLAERRDFRELLKLVNDIAIDEEAYLVGADFTYRNILERSLGFETPSIVIGDEVIPYSKLIDLMYTEKRTKGRVSSVLNVLRRSRGSKSESGSLKVTSSKSSKRRSSFVEKQELKRKLSRASLGSCEGNVCREQ